MKRRTPSPSTDTNIVPPSTAPFPYADYVETKTALQQALRAAPFYALVAGASGMGKTSLLRDIATGLDRHRHTIVYISSANASLVGVVRFLAQALHVTPRRSYLETVRVLTEAIGAHTGHLLLWLDEAHEVEPDTMQELRKLAECHLGQEQLLSVVLSGLPELISQLDAPRLFPLKRRIAMRFVLAGLRRDELDAFVEHRFGTNDAARVPHSVRDDLFERTQATPALIDAVLRRALQSRKAGLDADEIRAILDKQGL